MITRIAAAVVYVSDQDRALTFYRDVLDFEVIMDVPMNKTSRWIEVKPRGAETSIVLALASALDKQPGDGAFLTFASDDVAATVKQLRARGASTSEVIHEQWGHVRDGRRPRRPQTAVQRASTELTEGLRSRTHLDAR